MSTSARKRKLKKIMNVKAKPEVTTLFMLVLTSIIGRESRGRRQRNDAGGRDAHSEFSTKTIAESTTKNAPNQNAQNQDAAQKLSLVLHVAYEVELGGEVLFKIGVVVNVSLASHSLVFKCILVTDIAHLDLSEKWSNLRGDPKLDLVLHIYLVHGALVEGFLLRQKIA